MSFNVLSDSGSLRMASDTSREADEILIHGYRAMEPQKRLVQAVAMSGAVVRLAEARIRKEHVGISERDLRMRLASLWLDPDIMVRAFGWDPRKEGY